MAAISGGSGVGGGRGGWSWTLQTESILKDPGDQFSLSQGLRAGVAMAHDHQQMMTDVQARPEGRNFRRSEYAGRKHRHIAGGR